MNKKDEILRELDDGELLEMAGSVSGAQADSSTSRSVLTRIVRESFSLGEIKERVKLAKGGLKEGKLIADGLRVGGIGQLLLSASAIIPSLSYYSNIVLPLSFTFGSLQTLSLVGIASSLIFLLFLAMFWISGKRVANIYGESRAMVFGVLVGLVACLAALSYHVLALLGVMAATYIFTSGYTPIPTGVFLVLPLAYCLFLGLMLILVGIFFFEYRKRFLNTELWLLAGITYVFAGVSELWYVSDYIFSETIVLGGILGALCFLTSRPLERHRLVKLTRDELMPGTIGQGFFVASTLLVIAGYAAIGAIQTTYVGYYQVLAPWGLASSLLFMVFGLLFGVSMVSVAPKLGGNNVGKSSALLGVITGFVGMLYYGLTILGVAIITYPTGSTDLNELGFALLVAYRVLIGVTMVFIGVFLLLNHKRVSSSELWMLCGLMYIVIGSDQFSIESFLYIPLPLLAAGIIGLACFLGGKVAE